MVKTGHFYFGLTETFAQIDNRNRYAILKIISPSDKAKPFVREGQKAPGLKDKMAELPKETIQKELTEQGETR